MTDKNFQEINFASVQEPQKQIPVYKKGMTTIKCVCGCEILVVIDLEAIERAIKSHIAQHKQADYGLALLTRRRSF